MSDQQDRMIHIETLLAHLQQDIEQINSSLTHHFQRLQTIEDRFGRLERELELMQQPQEKRDPEQEKPPHY